MLLVSKGCSGDSGDTRIRTVFPAVEEAPYTCNYCRLVTN